MNDISIRMANTTDAGLIADLSRETFYNAFAIYNTKEDMDKFMSEVFTREKLMSEIYFTDNIFLLAYKGREVAGYVRLRDKHVPETPLESDNIIEIARIYTTSAEIGKGIGTALLNECVSIARQKQRDFIWLGVWEKNDKAIRFYERNGFIRFGEHEFVLGNDVQTDWLMCRRL